MAPSQLLPDPAPSAPALAQGEVVANRSLAPGCHWLDLNLAAPAPALRAGQFHMLRAQADWSPLLARPFSVAAAEKDGRKLGFLIEVAGRGSGELSRLSPGAQVTFWGPLGNCFPRNEKALLLAGGVGFAPFLNYYQETGGTLLFGGRSAAHVAAASLLPAGAGVHLATDDGSQGFHGTVVDLLAHLLDAGELAGDSPLYVCGPTPMMAAAARLAASRGLPCLVSLETKMGCGLGICSGCAVPVIPGNPRFGEADMTLACKQGPIFPAVELDWDRLGK